MSKGWSSRDQVKRRFKQSDKSLETAQRYLLDCLNLYTEGGYERHTLATDSLMTLIQMNRDMLQSIQRQL